MGADSEPDASSQQAIRTTALPRDWAMFYDQFAQEVLSIMQYTWHDKDIAEESTDEAFCKAFEHWESFGPDFRQRRRWVIQTALNHARSRWRRRERQRARGSTDIEPERLTPADRSDEMALIVTLRAELVRLPRQQCAVMVLRHLCDLDTREVAEILGISVKTVAVHEHRAKKRLRELLQGQEVHA